MKRPLLALTILARFFGSTTVTREAGVTSRLAMGTPSASATFNSRLMVGTLLPVSIWLSMARLTPASLARRSREWPWRVRSRFKFVLIVAKRAVEWFVRCFARDLPLTPPPDLPRFAMAMSIVRLKGAPSAELAHRCPSDECEINVHAGHKGTHKNC